MDDIRSCDADIFFTPTVAKSDVNQQLWKLDAFKSATHDNLHPRMLIELVEAYSGLLMLSCNTFWDNGKVSGDWE